MEGIKDGYKMNCNLLDYFQRNKMSPPIDRQAIHQTIKDVSKAYGNELKKLNYKDYKSCHDCDIPLTWIVKKAFLYWPMLINNERLFPKKV